MTSRKRGNSGKLKRRLCIALRGEFALEKAIDMSQERQENE